MNIKRFLAAASASIVAVSAMSIAAFAGDVSGGDYTDDGSGNFQRIFSSDNYDLTKITSVELTFELDLGDPWTHVDTVDDDGNVTDQGCNQAHTSNWCGGKFILQSDSLGWDDLGEWTVVSGCETSDKAFVYTADSAGGVQSFSESFSVSLTDADDYFTLTIQNYGADMTVTSIKYLDDEGNEVQEKPEEVPGDSDDGDGADDGTTSDDTTSSDNTSEEESKPVEEESKPEESAPVVDNTPKIKPAYEQNVPEITSGPADQRPVPEIGYKDGTTNNGGNNGGTSGDNNSTTNPTNPGDTTNPGTGVAIAFAPALLAGAAVVVAKKRK